MDKVTNNGEDVTAKRDELKPRKTSLGKQTKSTSSSKTTPQQLTRRLEALGVKLDELLKRGDAADSLVEALQGRSEALEKSTQTLGTQTDGLQTKTDDLATKLEGVSGVATAMEERVSQLAATGDELTAQLEALKNEIAALTDKNDAFTATKHVLEERAGTLESATGELKTQMEAFQERSCALEAHTAQLEAAVKALSPRVDTLYGVTENLTTQGDTLKTHTEHLEKQLGDFRTATDQLSVRADRLENKQATQAALLKDLVPRTNNHIARSRQIFWSLGGAVVVLAIAGVWLHLNHMNRIDAKMATVDTQLKEASQAQGDLQMRLTETQTGMEQTSRSLEQMGTTLKEQDRLLNDLKGDSQTVQSTDSAAPKPTGRENAADRLGASLHDARWLLAQPAEHYTLQLLTATNEAWLVNLVKRYPLPSESAHFRTVEGGWYRYRVVTGAYANPRAAFQALESLPEPWQRYNPWIRKIGPMQETISAR